MKNPAVTPQTTVSDVTSGTQIGCLRYSRWCLLRKRWGVPEVVSEADYCRHGGTVPRQADPQFSEPSLFDTALVLLVEGLTLPTHYVVLRAVRTVAAVFPPEHFLHYDWRLGTRLNIDVVLVMFVSTRSQCRVPLEVPRCTGSQGDCPRA